MTAIATLGALSELTKMRTNSQGEVNVAIGNKGRVIIPKPAQAANAALGVRKETDKRWRDWLSVALDYYYWRGTMGGVVAEFAKYRGIDPKEVPPIRIEDMR